MSSYYTVTLSYCVHAIPRHWYMRGHPWSKDTREAVLSASRLGANHTITEAITGVSKRGIQRIISESNSWSRPHQRSERKTLLNNEHRAVSWTLRNSSGWRLFIFYSLVFEGLPGPQPLCLPRWAEDSVERALWPKYLSIDHLVYPG